jgi:hypothetical protein
MKTLYEIAQAAGKSGTLDGRALAAEWSRLHRAWSKHHAECAMLDADSQVVNGREAILYQAAADLTRALTAWEKDHHE